MTTTDHIIRRTRHNWRVYLVALWMRVRHARGITPHRTGYRLHVGPVNAWGSTRYRACLSWAAVMVRRWGR